MVKPRPKAWAKVLGSVARDTWAQMKQAQLPQAAASLAYTTILSLIPVLAMSFAIFKAFGGLDTLLDTIQPFILSNLAEGASEEVIARIQSFIENAHASALGAGGFLGLVVTSMSMLYSIEKAINRVWGTPIRRSWFQRISSYWLFITLGPVAFSFILGAATSSRIPLTDVLPSGSGIFILTTGIFYAVYKYVPNCKVDRRFALLSALFTAILWNLARMAYALYTVKAVSYSKIYGSLGAIPILLIWIYIVWLVILTGAALTAALQRRIPTETIA
ncbi:MAG: YihY family inner membrane protein [Oligoflexia bacterium]|nr:YihY family inner membrane protein [Oligoflexia bacterium]